MLKITVIPIVFMFLVSALIVPVGISYATYDESPAFTPSTTTTTTPTNQTKTNMTMTAAPTNQTKTNMTMTAAPTNQTKTNMTMTAAPTNQTSTTPKPSAPLTPLKQFKSGISAKDVQCQSGFSLILKASDGSPACVHSSSVQILIQRGWAAIQ